MEEQQNWSIRVKVRLFINVPHLCEVVHGSIGRKIEATF
jgi:hypothetical protein